MSSSFRICYYIELVKLTGWSHRYILNSKSLNTFLYSEFRRTAEVCLAHYEFMRNNLAKWIFWNEIIIYGRKLILTIQFKIYYMLEVLRFAYGCWLRAAVCQYLKLRAFPKCACLINANKIKHCSRWSKKLSVHINWNCWWWLLYDWNK